jgi:hypothetical protein
MRSFQAICGEIKKMARREIKSASFARRFRWRGVQLHGSIKKSYEALGNLHRLTLRARIGAPHSAGHLYRLR